TFSLWNSVLEAEALRDSKRYPASSNIAKSLARQLLVDHEDPLRELGLSLDAIHAVADMAELSSRQKHRITAQLRELLPNLSAQAAVVDLPRACARAGITDEDFFPEFADCLARFWPMADSRQLTACWRSLLQWRVGPPGLDRCAAAVFCDAHCSAWTSGLSPGAAVRHLRALGRLGPSVLPASEAREEAEVALLVALRATLLALLAPAAEHSLDSRDLLLAMNALGQIARGAHATSAAFVGEYALSLVARRLFPFAPPIPRNMAGEQPKKPIGGAYGIWVAKLAGNRYKTLGEDVKAEYQKKFDEAKAKYEADMKAFLDAGGEKKGTKRKADKASKPKKDPAAPKKPAGGAFGCFLAKNRAAFTKEVEGQPITAITKLASEKWKNLSEDEKKVYQAEYETKKAEYEEAKKSYVPLPSAEKEETGKPAKKARLSKEGKAVAKQTKDLEKEKKVAEKKEKMDAK
ncbi:SSRP1, partial [Symbiodinium sp. CCMP2456]